MNDRYSVLRPQLPYSNIETGTSVRKAVAQRHGIGVDYLRSFQIRLRCEVTKFDLLERRKTDH